MNLIGIIILCAVIADFLLHFIADCLNLGKLDRHLPQIFAGWYDEERYAKSQEYLRVNTRFEWVAGLSNMGLFLLLWWGRGFPVIDQWVRSVSHVPVISGILYIGVLFSENGRCAPVFHVFTFNIEERFRVQQHHMVVFITDRIKQLVLAALIGGPLLAGVLAFFEYAGDHAWLYCWVVVVGFMIFMQFAVPAWIMPLFNKFKPLEAGELKTAIMNYARSIDFPIKKIFIMDGSRRSGKSNAFFSGFGRHKRIVLYDTLVKNHAPDELVAVLAHEMGHYKKNHVLWMLLAGIVQTGVMLYLLSLFISSPLLFEAFYMETTSVYAGLVFFGILFAPIEFFMGIAMQYFSRKNEYAADRFAVETTGKPGAFCPCPQKTCSSQPAPSLTPHPCVILNYSHPPVLQRLANLTAS
ncbi:MAG: M48 family metallopeptidase [Desulfobacterales bacterium]